MENKEYELLNYAKRFANLLTKDTRFLVYRDIPMLIKKYVDGTTALDYGCGPGHSTKLLKSLGLDVKGVDINEYMIQCAKEQDPDGDYVLIQREKVPDEDESYDLIISEFVLVHASTKLEMLNILREVARLLKKGGILIVIVANENSYKSNYVSTDCNFEENRQLFSGSIVKLRFVVVDLTVTNYYWTDEDYQEVIFEAGFDIVAVHEPLGKDSDGYEWKDEKLKPPCTIYVAKKEKCFSN